MLHIPFLIVGGFLLGCWLHAMSEQLWYGQLPRFPGEVHIWLALVAAVCVVVTAWTHTWKRLLIAMVAATVYVMLRTDWRRWKEKRARGKERHTPESYANSGSKP